MRAQRDPNSKIVSRTVDDDTKADEEDTACEMLARHLVKTCTLRLAGFSCAARGKTRTVVLEVPVSTLHTKAAHCGTMAAGGLPAATRPIERVVLRASLPRNSM